MNIIRISNSIQGTTLTSASSDTECAWRCAASGCEQPAMTSSTCALQESDVTFQQDTGSYVLLKTSGTGKTCTASLMQSKAYCHIAWMYIKKIVIIIIIQTIYKL